jgi:aspartate-semialdehyde dehydrogenase
MSFRVAIVGATGAVGTEFLRVLEDRDFPVGDLRLIASSRSSGRTLTFCGEAHEVVELGDGVFEGVDVAFFSAGADRSRDAAPMAVSAGAVVIDNSSAFRMDENVPLVVPEANAEAGEHHRGIIANPNCSTILLAVVLAPLVKAAPLRRIVVSTYQAVSGAGARALLELDEQREAEASGRSVSASVFPSPIDLNVLPRIGPLGPDGVSEEEAKMGREMRKILDDPDLEVSATCVRVPVRRAHSEAVHLEFDRDLDHAGAADLLRSAPGVRVVECDRATPLMASGRDEVLVSRIRNAPDRSDTLDLWLTGDQLRKGAALNAVQIAEHLLARRALAGRREDG